ncbi:MAG: NnrU family protein [Pseudomonadota bacterium]
MTLLLIGLAVFMIGHFWKRVMAGTYALIGAPAKGISAGIILVGLVMIIFGYRSAPFETVYTPPTWGAHLNWVLMFIAVGLLGAGHSKGNIKTWFRHPMLLSVIVWAIAHLLANGDLASVLMFGTLGLWALLEIFVVNKATGPWGRPASGPLYKDFVLLGITVAVYAVFVALHIWAGVNPFATLG